VVLKRGAGTFGGARKYRTGYDEGTSEHRLAVIDLNGDGKPDLATPNSAQDWISVLLNKGDGSFESRLNYRTRRSPVSVVTADLNGDDKPDAVTANTNYTVSVLLNMPGLCNVQDIRDMTVRAAKRKLARVNCRVGKVARVYSVGWKKGRVISQKPKIGAVLPGGGKVNLVISRGRRT